MARSTLAFGCLALALVACEPATEVELLSVERVEPARLEPGGGIRVVGRGFPAGRPVEVRVVGTLHRPGRAPRPVTIRLPGLARSEELVDAAVPSTALPRGPLRGTLRGRVTVRVSAAHGAGILAGRSDELALDLRGDPERRREELRRALSSRGEVRALFSALGADLAESPDGGVVIEAVHPGSLAEDAGLGAGQQLRVAHGVRVESLGDLLPPPAAAHLTLEVAAAGSTETRSVVLDRPADDGAEARTLLAGLRFAAGWLILCLLLFAPTGRALDALRGRADQPAPPRIGWRVLGVLATVAGLLAWGGVLDRLDLPTIALGLGAVRLTASWLGSVDVPLRRRARILGAAVVAALLLAVGGAGLALLGGTGDLGTLQVGQTLSPLGWGAFATPFGVPLAGLLLVGAALGDPHGGVGLEGRTARLLDHGVRVLVAGVVTAAFLGGFPARAHDDASARWLLAYLVPALLLALALGRLRVSPTTRALLVSTLAAVAVGVSIGLWTAVGGVPLVASALAPVIACGVVVAGVLVGLRARRPPTAMSVPGAYL